MLRKRSVRPYEHSKHASNFKSHDRHWRPCGRIFTFCKFWRKKKEIEPFDVICENSSPKRFFWPNKKKSVISLPSADSRYFRTYTLNKGMKHPISSCPALFWQLAEILRVKNKWSVACFIRPLICCEGLLYLLSVISQLPVLVFYQRHELLHCNIGSWPAHC